MQPDVCTRPARTYILPFLQGSSCEFLEHYSSSVDMSGESCCYEVQMARVEVLQLSMYLINDLLTVVKKKDGLLATLPPMSRGHMLILTLTVGHDY